MHQPPKLLPAAREPQSADSGLPLSPRTAARGQDVLVTPSPREDLEVAVKTFFGESVAHTCANSLNIAVRAFNQGEEVPWDEVREYVGLFLPAVIEQFNFPELYVARENTMTARFYNRDGSHEDALVVDEQPVPEDQRDTQAAERRLMAARVIYSLSLPLPLARESEPVTLFPADCSEISPQLLLAVSEALGENKKRLAEG
jgi:hypothetical protein